jgi:antitoxin (DNA-binding transcriptional repressor) of toxin-antitoxin stability system
VFLAASSQAKACTPTATLALRWNDPHYLLAFPSHLRHNPVMSMTTLTPTSARMNLSRLLVRALEGEDIGILVRGKIVALRPVTVEATDYAMREYGASETELKRFEKRVHGQVKKARKTGKLRNYPGDVEALVARKGHR